MEYCCDFYYMYGFLKFIFLTVKFECMIMNKINKYQIYLNGIL